METKNIALGGILILIIGIIVALAIVPEIATRTTEMSQKNTVTNEQVTITTAQINSTDINTSKTFVVTSAPSGWKATECPLTNFVLGNATDDFTLTTDYTVTLSNGTFLLKNTAKVRSLSVNNITLVDYTYCQDGYITNSGGRSIAGIIVLTAALGLLGFVIFYAIRGLKNN